MAFRFFDAGPGASEGPRKVPLGYPLAFPGDPGASRRPPGPKTKQTKKPRNLNELTEQWRYVRNWGRPRWDKSVAHSYENMSFLRVRGAQFRPLNRAMHKI